MESAVKYNGDRDIEVLVVTPNTKLEIKENKIVTKVLHDNSEGVSRARNIGIKGARGRIIAFVDADCIVENNWIGEIIRFFDKQNDKCIVSVQGKHWLYTKSNWYLRAYGEYRKQNAIEHIYNYNGTLCIERLDSRNFAILGRIAKKFYFKEKIISEEDRELGHRLISNGYRLGWNKKMVTYHQPHSFKSLIKKQFTYGIGSAKWRKLTVSYCVRKYYLNPIKLYYQRKINFTTLLISLISNTLYQVGQIYSKIKR